MTAKYLASTLGISIDDARRYIATGLSQYNIEACAKFAAQGVFTLDEVVDMAVRRREQHREETQPIHTGTVKRSRRATVLGSM
jgi:hypothetical protein